MPSNSLKNSATSPSTLQQLIISFKIYGLYWTVKLTILFIFRKIYYEYFLHSYSQYGEDLIIEKILNKKNIFYIDIGANHPKKFNNTYKFYKTGSRGINIEPNLSLLKKFKIIRKLDKNLNIGISNHNGKMTFYQMFPDVNSTFSYKQYRQNISKNSILISKIKIPVKTLESVLNEFYIKHQTIDLLSIDTEGFDYQVLQGNNWKKYSPSVICIETQVNKLEKDFLLKLDYQLYAKTQINSIYIKKGSTLLPGTASL